MTTQPRKRNALLLALLLICSLSLPVAAAGDQGNMAVLLTNDVPYVTDQDKVAPPGYADPTSALPFVDVATSRWSYHQIVIICNQAKLMQGITDSSFAPTAPATRGMLATILWRLADSPDPTSSAPFTDVNDSAWYGPAVAWAWENEIISGASDTIFSPNAPLTREDLVTMLYRWDQKLGGGGLTGSFMINMSQYTDLNQVAQYASEPFAWAKINGIVDGVTKDTLAPKAVATREQTAAILARYLQSDLIRNYGAVLFN